MLTQHKTQLLIQHLLLLRHSLIEHTFNESPGRCRLFPALGIHQ